MKLGFRHVYGVSSAGRRPCDRVACTLSEADYVLSKSYFGRAVYGTSSFQTTSPYPGPLRTGAGRGNIFFAKGYLQKTAMCILSVSRAILVAAWKAELHHLRESSYTCAWRFELETLPPAKNDVETGTGVFLPSASGRIEPIRAFSFCLARDRIQRVMVFEKFRISIRDPPSSRPLPLGPLRPLRPPPPKIMTPKVAPECRVIFWLRRLSNILGRLQRSPCS